MKAFLQHTRRSSRILFCIWLGLSILYGIALPQLFVLPAYGFAAFLLGPALVIEYRKNPVLVPKKPAIRQNKRVVVSCIIAYFAILMLLLSFVESPYVEGAAALRETALPLFAAVLLCLIPWKKFLGTPKKPASADRASRPTSDSVPRTQPKAEQPPIPQKRAQVIRNEYRQMFGVDPDEGYDWKYKETWEDYPVPNYDALHTYCSVVFDDSGKSFYYRTRNPELQVGDWVLVPVGRKYENKLGQIVAMEEVRGYDAPYPLERTKYIRSKADAPNLP